MQVALIIPLYNQTKYWNRMQTAIEQLSVKPYCVYIMMDRPLQLDYQKIKTSISNQSLTVKYKLYNIQEIPEYVGRPNIIPEQVLFLTGDRRNKAINYAIADGCDSFVFIDGDCIPQEDLIKSHHEMHSNNYPVLTCGRRREEKHNYKDQRETVANLKACNLFVSNVPQVITSYDLLKTSAIAWSCNMGLNLKAVKLLRLVNMTYYGKSDVFHSNFSGTWGGEDGFIGMQSYLCGIKVILLCDMKSGIKHIDHDRPPQKYSGEAFISYLADQVEVFKYYMMNKPLTIDFFD